MKNNLITLFPAIDVKDGKCVRLLNGDMKKDTIYNNNPVDQAIWFVDQGAEWLHIVDLDGAVTGSNVNRNVISKIVHKLQDKVKIQIGGGIRNINDIDFWIQKSVSRVILGTLALENPNFINNLDEKYSQKIVIGADVRDGKIASNGWKNQTNVSSIDLLKSLNSSIVSSVIYTDISKDGTLKGVSIEKTVNFAKSIPHLVIASGGVSSLNDIARLSKERSKGIEGVIIGRALYEKKFTFSEALLKSKEFCI